MFSDFEFKHLVWKWRFAELYASRYLNILFQHDDFVSCCEHLNILFDNEDMF